MGGRTLILALLVLPLLGWWWHERGRPMPAAPQGLALPDLSGRPGAAGTGAPPPRRCTAPDGRITYTDGACPQGHVARDVAGQVTVVPGTRPAAAAGSAPTPLRRLAGEGAIPDLAERQVEQALKR